MPTPEKTLPNRESFQRGYEGRPAWDIEGPQPNLVTIADRITGTLLDAGCGTGENALFFASRGCSVTGFDFLSAPVQRAKEKAAIRNLDVTFLVKDALTLKDTPPEWSAKFDHAIDSGLFHVFSDADQQKYIAGLHRVLKPGGHLYLLCFSDAEPGVQGPRRIPKQLLLDQFAEGWKMESITATHFGVRNEFRGEVYSKEGPHAWFAIVRKM